MSQQLEYFLGKIWYKIANELDRWDIEWEWMKKNPNGEFVKRQEVLDLIDKYIKYEEGGHKAEASQQQQKIDSLNAKVTQLHIQLDNSQLLNEIMRCELHNAQRKDK